MKIYPWLYIVIIFVMQNCFFKPKQKVLVLGKVLHVGTGRPVDSANVGLTDRRIDSGGNHFFRKSKYVYSDSTGSFKVRLKYKYQPYVTVSKKGYYELDYKKLIDKKEKNGQKDTLYLVSTSSFCGVFVCKENNCDSLKIVFLPYSSPHIGYTPRTKIYTCVRGIHCYDATKPVNFCDENALYGAAGESYMRFKLQLKRNGTWAHHIDSVFLETNKTFKDTIYY